MQLSFETIDELDHFLQWATKYGAVRAEDVSPDSPAYQAALARAESASRGKIVATQLADNVPRAALDEQQAASEAQQGGEPQTTQASTAPRAKRRTKAELAAGKQASVLSVNGLTAVGPITITGQSDVVAEELPSTPANPFSASAPAADAALDASQGKTGLTVEVDLDVVGAAEITEKAAEYLANGDADNQMLHLTSSRHVMDKHGLDVYRSSLDGLPGNIVEHTREHRAEHMARLWALG